MSAFWLKKERDSAVVAERKARQQTFEALLAQARASRFSRRVGQRFGTLDTVREAVALLDDLGLPEEQRQARRDELRDLAIAALTLVDVRRVGADWPDDVGSLYVDVARGLYLRSDNLGNLLVCRLRDGSEVTRLHDLSHADMILESLERFSLPEGE